MLSDLEFAKTQYKKLLDFANFYATYKSDAKDYDEVIQACVDGMASCLARIRELEQDQKLGGE